MTTEQLHPESSEGRRQTDWPDRGGGASVWRLLHIEEDEVDALKVTLALRYEVPTGSKLDHACDLQQAASQLRSQRYDAVLTGLSITESQCFDSLQELVAEHSETPVLILSDDEGPAAAMRAGRCGASGFLVKSSLTSDLLGQALRKAIQGSSGTTDRGLLERRKDPRYSVEAPAIIFPIQTDGNPGCEIAAITVDVSLGGIGLLAKEDSEAVPDICLVGVECQDGTYRYATVQWRQRRLALPAIRFGGSFLRCADDPFHETRLTPRFDPKTLRYQPAMERRTFSEWAARGILRPQQVDRVKGCPHCEALLTFRDGCPLCGSPLTAESQLLHHFACAHVAPLADFGDTGLACPKCRAQNLVVGADFEYLIGPYRCLECEWSDSETALIAECMQCAHRFPAKEAIEKDVYVYHVNRLDPMALLEEF